MGRNKRGSAAADIYNGFLYGKFANNNSENHTALIQRMYWRVLTELAANRFKWSGFENYDSIDVRFLETTLFWNAVSIFYWDKRYNKYFALKGGGANWLNMTDNPVGFSVIGNNFVGMNISAIKETADAGIGIPIWANYMRIPDVDIVSVYSQKLAEIDVTIEINSRNARQSKVIKSSEGQRLSATNFNRQVDEGLNGISVSGLPGELIVVEALDLGIDPDLLEKLHILRTRLWNECMGLLGIENANQDKKERLVTAEVGANDDQTSMMRYVNLNARRMAAKKINDTYGLNVSVEYYTDVERQAAQAMVTPQTIGAENRED